MVKHILSYWCILKLVLSTEGRLIKFWWRFKDFTTEERVQTFGSRVRYSPRQAPRQLCYCFSWNGKCQALWLNAIYYTGEGRNHHRIWVLVSTWVYLHAQHLVQVFEVMEKQKLIDQIGLVALALHRAICQAVYISCVSMNTLWKQIRNGMMLAFWGRLTYY